MKNKLEERLTIYSENILETCKLIRWNVINKTIISQLIRSSTSVGANYKEANNSGSFRDFRNKVYICVKEIHETLYWVRLLTKTEKNNNQKFREIYQETLELTKIFDSIIYKINTKHQYYIKKKKK